MVIRENDSRHDTLLGVACSMMTAARTAPKACGRDNLEIVCVASDSIGVLSEQMRIVGARLGKAFFLRDADNIMKAEAVVLIGTRNAVLNLNCSLCGFETCADKMAYPNVPCMFNSHDLGLAVGSAVSVAADHRVDSRVMYSAGTAAMSLGWLPDCHAVMAIPISSLGKSPFFDRAQ